MKVTTKHLEVDIQSLITAGFPQDEALQIVMGMAELVLLTGRGQDTLKVKEPLEITNDIIRAYIAMRDVMAIHPILNGSIDGKNEN